MTICDFGNIDEAFDPEMIGKARAGEVFISVDVEATGPIPGPYSMISLGAAAFVPSLGEHPLATFRANLKELTDAERDPRTMNWWRKHPDAWKTATDNPVAPAIVMRAFADWLHAFPNKPVFVGWPATYDFMFTYWYLIYWTEGSPFSFSGLDLKTMAANLLGIPYRSCTKAKLPARWLAGTVHDHDALQDAIGQGVLLCRMLTEITDQRRRFGDCTPVPNDVLTRRASFEANSKVLRAKVLQAFEAVIAPSYGCMLPDEYKEAKRRWDDLGKAVRALL